MDEEWTLIGPLLRSDTSGSRRPRAIEIGSGPIALLKGAARSPSGSNPAALTNLADDVMKEQGPNSRTSAPEKACDILRHELEAQ